MSNEPSITPPLSDDGLALSSSEEAVITMSFRDMLTSPMTPLRLLAVARASLLFSTSSSPPVFSDFISITVKTS